MKENPRYLLDGRRLFEVKALANNLILASSLSILILLLAMPYAPLTKSSSINLSAARQLSNPTDTQTNNATNQIVTNLTIMPTFDLLNTNELSQVSVLITAGQIPANSSAIQLAITTSFNPQLINGTATFANSSALVNLQRSALATVAATAKSFVIIIPSNATSAEILIQGNGGGQSILGRMATVVPFVSVQSSLPSFASSLNIITPRGDIISQTYGGFAASEIEGSVLEANPTPTTIGAPAGEWLYVVPFPVTTIVLQPSWFGTLSLVLIVIAAAVVALAAIGLFGKGRAVLKSLLATITRILDKIYSPILKLTHSKSNRPNYSNLKSLLLDSKRLLVLFLACGMIMISVAALSGPDPTFKAYVIATPAELPQIQTQLENIVQGNVQIITPSQDYNDFEVMSNVGTFNMVVVSQYSTLQLQNVGGSVLPFFRNVPIIVMDNSSDPTFASQIRALYPEVISIGSITAPNQTEVKDISLAVQLNQRQNILGLQISNGGFQEILATEGGLSFVLFFLGALFLGAKVTEVSNKSGEDKTLFRIAQVAVYGIFVFYFTEAVYVVTSSTLAFPLSLHAVVSGATSITAVGLFGKIAHLPLGGGTTPRLVSGALGFFIGAYAVGSNRLFNKYSLALITGIVLILLLNPFYVGVVLYQIILLFVGSVSTGFAASSALTFKGFLYGYGLGLGGDVSSASLLSAGKILYFAALAPLAFIKKMGKTTAGITLLVASLAIGDGGVRTGEMTPDKTVAAVFPGLIAGLAFAAVLLSISLIEKYVTTGYARSRP